MENRFCFVAIVKNESHVIKRCIDSISNVANSYLICDTGSTDDTPKIIEEYMKEKQIPGKVIYLEWKNYAHNKSYLMEQAYYNNNAKYFIWHDADEVFIKNKNDPTSYLTKDDANILFNWLESKNEPIIQIKTIYETLHYLRPNIVRNNQLYKWLSPKHEWLFGTKDIRTITYNNFILFARQEGNASKDPLRCQKDVKLFLDYIEENGGYEKCPREVFYLAQEYETFDKENAIKYYKLKVKIPMDFIQENYIAYLRLGRLIDNEDKKIKYWEKGFELIPHRLECIYEIMKFYMAKENFLMAYHYASLAVEKREINIDDMFVESDIYDYKYDLDYSVVAYYNNKYEISNLINQKNMSRNFDKPCMGHLLLNQKFIDQKLDENNLFKCVPIKQDVNNKLL